MTAVPADDGTMEVRVRLFAMLRERAGADEVALTLPAGATVAQALSALAERTELAAALADMPVVLAVNREYATGSLRLRPGDEVAVVPPVSGGSPEERPDAGAPPDAGHGPVRSAGADDAEWVRVGSEAIDVATLVERVGDPGAGATVVFLGTTRDVAHLEYEVYAEMARERIASILHDCVVRHRLRAAAAEHRVGPVPLGETSVGVAVSAPHRAEAFAAARAAIDRIKAEAPIWKKEVEAGDAPRECWVDGTPPRPTGLTHVDERGAAWMVDVGGKPATERRARARAIVRMAPATAAAALAGDAPKGDVIATARLAGIQAAKRTAELIPLAHPVAVSWVDVEIAIDPVAGSVAIEGEARTVAGTGVELEALTAASVAALTVYDMVKALERGVEVEHVCLLEKSGGSSGSWLRDDR